MLNYLASLLSSRSGRPAREDLSTLCKPCSSIFRGQYKDKPLGVTATHHFPQSFELLQSSAEADCHLCYIRWNDLTLKDRDALRGCTKITYGFWKSNVGDGIAYEYFFPIPHAIEKPCLTLSVLFKPLDGKSTYLPSRHVQRLTNQKNFQIVLPWEKSSTE